MWFILEALIFSVAFTSLLRILWSQECTHFRQTANNKNAVPGGQEQHDIKTHQAPVISMPAEQAENPSGQPPATKGVDSGGES